MCAFRTLDLGFEKDLTVILNSLNCAGAGRQNVLLSATLTQGKRTVEDFYVELVRRDVSLRDCRAAVFQV